jgi:hypothetical protein
LSKVQIPLPGFYTAMLATAHTVTREFASISSAMKARPTMRRATKLVKQPSRTMLWFVDAADPVAIRCRKWHFRIEKLAEEAARALANGMTIGLNSDTLVSTVSMIADGEVRVCDSMLVAVEFFSGGNNVAMRREAHAMLSALPPT